MPPAVGLEPPRWHWSPLLYRSDGSDTITSTSTCSDKAQSLCMCARPACGGLKRAPIAVPAGLAAEMASLMTSAARTFHMTQCTGCGGQRLQAAAFAWAECCSCSAGSNVWSHFTQAYAALRKCWAAPPWRDPVGLGVRAHGDALEHAQSRDAVHDAGAVAVVEDASALPHSPHLSHARTLTHACSHSWMCVALKPVLMPAGWTRCLPRSCWQAWCHAG